MSSSTYLARAIQGLLQAQMGTYSEGSLVVRSTGATGTVPKHAFAIPIVDDQLHEDATVFVQANPDTSDGSWAVTDAGVELPVQSLQGGERMNLDAGVECRWDPELSGIEATSEVASGGLTGGILRTVRGTLRQLRLAKSFGSTPESQDFFRAQVSHYPGAVLAWLACYPADSSSGPSLGPQTARVSAGRRMWAHEWALSLITSRTASQELRIREGDQLRDDCLELLTDRCAYRGLQLSYREPGIEIIDARLARVTASSYVDLVRFATIYPLTRRDERTFTDWLMTRNVIRTEDQTPYPEIDLVDETLVHS
jgi:hypothetical protein